MNLVLLRHATREAALDFAGADPALTPEGLHQAEDFITHVQPHGPLPAPTHILSSPRLRARQTLAPLARAFHLELKSVPFLDERGDTESSLQFEKRVQGILSAHEIFRDGREGVTVYACSHLDVIQAAVQLWPTDLTEHAAARSWSTLEYQVFHVDLSRSHGPHLQAGLRSRVAPRGVR